MAKRQDILSAAGTLFREHGYHATTMRGIAKSLEMRGSSLYAHVDSKEAMLFEIVTQAADAFKAQAESVAPSLDAKARLEALIRGHLAVIARELPNATVFFHDWRFLSTEARRNITERRDAYEQYFRDVIAQGVESGVFYTDNAKVATLFILSALNGSYEWFDPQGALSLEEISDYYVDYVLNALAGGRGEKHAN